LVGIRITMDEMWESFKKAAPYLGAAAILNLQYKLFSNVWKNFKSVLSTSE